MEFVIVMFWAALCMTLAIIVGDILGRIISPPINAWVERQMELEEEKELLGSKKAAEPNYKRGA